MNWIDWIEELINYATANWTVESTGLKPSIELNWTIESTAKKGGRFKGSKVTPKAKAKPMSPLKKQKRKEMEIET